LALLALLAACGSLPRPFEGRPGSLATQLAQPPPARLAVPVPTNALLSDEASQAYAEAVADALQQQEVPAVVDIARSGDWRLAVTAELRGDKVVPIFAVLDPNGQQRGATEGGSVDAALWADGTKPTLEKAAAAAAPALAELLTSIEAARRLSDPNSLANRPARIQVKTVTGAPGDGNHSLTRQIRLQLPQVGELVQDKAAGADFVVEGQVHIAAGAGGMQRVEIQWIVSDMRGAELGRVVQLNEVAPGTLDKVWGDVALVVAQEAAGGIRDVITNQTGPRASTQATPAKPAAAAP
jgi:hypothetical protein